MGRVVSLQSRPHVIPYCRRSEIKDVRPVAFNMREEDAKEVMAGCGQTPTDALLFCFFSSRPCMTIVGRSGNPIAMWGVVDQGERLGRVWMLGTDELVQDKPNSLQFLRQAKGWLARMLKDYDVLFNYVDARNAVHVKWLRWMGFTFIAEHPNYGHEGRTFLEFVRMSHV